MLQRGREVAFFLQAFLSFFVFFSHAGWGKPKKFDVAFSGPIHKVILTGHDTHVHFYPLDSGATGHTAFISWSMRQMIPEVHIKTVLKTGVKANLELGILTIEHMWDMQPILSIGVPAQTSIQATVKRGRFELKGMRGAIDLNLERGCVRILSKQIFTAQLTQQIKIKGHQIDAVFQFPEMANVSLYPPFASQEKKSFLFAAFLNRQEEAVKIENDFKLQMGLVHFNVLALINEGSLSIRKPKRPPSTGEIIAARFQNGAHALLGVSGQTVQHAASLIASYWESFMSDPPTAPPS